MVEGARLESVCTPNRVPRVRIPLSPPLLRGRCCLYNNGDTQGEGHSAPNNPHGFTAHLYGWEINLRLSCHWNDSRNPVSPGLGPARQILVNPVRSGRKQRQRVIGALRTCPTRAALYIYSLINEPNLRRRFSRSSRSLATGICSNSLNALSRTSAIISAAPGRLRCAP